MEDSLGKEWVKPLGHMLHCNKYYHMRTAAHFGDLCFQYNTMTRDNRWDLDDDPVSKGIYLGEV